MIWKECDFSELKGKTLLKVQRRDKDEDCLEFHTNDGIVYEMKHLQDCCESVTIEDICGPLEWLIDSSILLAEERSNSTELKKKDDDESFTWTFYEIATLRGAVTLRWYGSSNGYYSEAVSFGRYE